MIVFKLIEDYMPTRLTFLDPREAARADKGSSYLLLTRTALGRAYKTVLTITKVAPTLKLTLGRKSNNKALTKQEKMILKLVAKTLRTLSAYLTTNATINPPAAWTMTTVQTQKLYPMKKPEDLTVL
jgi:hypothetical protein